MEKKFLVVERERKVVIDIKDNAVFKVNTYSAEVIKLEKFIEDQKLDYNPKK